MRRLPSMKISRKLSPDGPAELHAIDAAAAMGGATMAFGMGGQERDQSPPGWHFKPAI